MINRSVSVWGSDAKEYKPERWLNEAGLPDKASQIQGHRHLLTFADGPRTCLGKSFALSEFKVGGWVPFKIYQCFNDVFFILGRAQCADKKLQFWAARWSWHWICHGQRDSPEAEGCWRRWMLPSPARASCWITVSRCFICNITLQFYLYSSTCFLLPWWRDFR